MEGFLADFLQAAPVELVDRFKVDQLLRLGEDLKLLLEQLYVLGEGETDYQVLGVLTKEDGH